jgi:hypothetical protein
MASIRMKPLFCHGHRLPAPVGPRNSRFPAGRPGEFSSAQNTWYKSATACTDDLPPPPGFEVLGLHTP